MTKETIELKGEEHKDNQEVSGAKREDMRMIKESIELKEE